MHQPRIDKDALCRMWEAEVPTREIAATFGVHAPAVSNAAKRLGLPRRGRGGYHRQPVAEPEPTPPAPGYAAIVEMAAANGLTLAQATSRFHRERSSR